MSTEAIQLLDQALSIATDLAQNGPGGWSAQGAEIATLLTRAKGVLGAAPEQSGLAITVPDLRQRLQSLPDHGRVLLSIELPCRPPQTWETAVSGYTQADDNTLVLTGRY